MSIKPSFVERAAQPYAAVRTKVLRPRIGEVAPPELTVVSEFLATHGIAVAGPPLIRYLVVDYGDAEVEIDIGFPIDTHAIPADARVRLAVLPEGRYACVVHAGVYEDLVHTTASLLESAQREGVEWADDDDEGVTRWAGRVEHYNVGPADVPDPTKWRTEIAIMVRDERMAAAK